MKQFKISGNFFKITDTDTGVQEYKDAASNTVNRILDGNVSFYSKSTGLKRSVEKYNIDNIVNGNDSDSPFASIDDVETYLDDNTGFNTPGATGEELEALDTRVETLEENQTASTIVVTNYTNRNDGKTFLPTVGLTNTLYTVANDIVDPTKNGNYYYEGGWVKSPTSVGLPPLSVLDVSNTAQSVNSKGVSDYALQKGGVVTAGENKGVSGDTMYKALKGASYMGIATNKDFKPTTPTGKEFYIAGEPGWGALSYRYFNIGTGIEIYPNEIATIRWNGSIWIKDVWSELPNVDYYTEVKLNNIHFFIGDNFTVGTVNKAKQRIDYLADQQPIYPQSFLGTLGYENPEVIKALKEIKRVFGVDPLFKSVIKSENIILNNTAYVKSTKLSIVSNLQFTKKELFSYTTFTTSVPISDATYSIEVSCTPQLKRVAGKSGFVEVISNSIYYESEHLNRYLENSIAKYLDVYPMINFKNINLIDSKGIQITKVDDTTLSITIPKGAALAARQLILPLAGFSIPLNEKEISDNFIMEFITEGADLSSIITFMELGVATATNICYISNIDSQAYSRNYNNDFHWLKTCRVSDTTNWHNIYNYKNVKLTLGSIASFVAQKDYHFTLKIRLRSLDSEFNLSNTLTDLKQKINSLSKFVGNYEVESKPVCKGLVSSSLPVSATLFKKGVSIPNLISENGTVLEYLFNISDYRTSGVLEPKIALIFSTNKYDVANISLTAEVMAMNGLKIQDALVDYSEIYNGIVRVNFELFEVVSDIKQVKVKIKLTSNNATGLEFYLSDSTVQGITIEKPISDRLYNLDYNVRNLIVKSDNGTKFILSVSNSGELSTLPFLPKKMMSMAHSWGLIPTSPASGWYGDWSLASSTLELGLHKQIETQCKLLNPEFQAFNYRFATFGQTFKNPTSWGEYNCSHLDFDSIFINSFVAAPSNGDWTGFGSALINLMLNTVCAGKTGVKIYIADAGAPTAELQIAASAFGTTLIDVSKAESVEGTGWPWKMPKNPLFPTTEILKVPSGQLASSTTMSGNTLGHPGNYGFYMIASNLKNQMATDYGVVNPTPTPLTFTQYKAQPSIAPYIDPLYPYSY